ncbi:hypothetical protein KUTeg_015687 [Tegillarca granosa]|uniref:Zinc finger PHD-type domain-containing protein n=1 Tax=Tegillarca granosa TaxID=220873 RepID=A0ABQ9ET29_TEGGR|nr:hypothetical protein KUTeg_015687 [Tegillarca granosa]
MTKHNLTDRPDRIYNIDETGINTQHKPLKIVCSTDTKAQAVTSEKSLTTIIGAGNAAGNHIPPYYVFKGKRWNSDLLTGCLPGAEELTAKPYLKAMSAENLVSAFRKTGIFPFNNKAITDVDIAPASIYKPAETEVPPNEDVTDTVIEVSNNNTQENNTMSFDTGSPEAQKKKKSIKQVKNPLFETTKVNGIKQQPSTSGTNKKGAPLDLLSEDGESSMDDEDDEKCCVCGKFQPDELHRCTSVVFTKWAKCDFCEHWTHLIYCTDVRFIRRGDEFRCPHCENQA